MQFGLSSWVYSGSIIVNALEKEGDLNFINRWGIHGRRTGKGDTKTLY